MAATQEELLSSVITLYFAATFQSGDALCFEGTVFLVQKSLKKKKVFSAVKKKKNPFFLFQEGIYVFFLIARSVSTILFYIKAIFIPV